MCILLRISSATANSKTYSYSRRLYWSVTTMYLNTLRWYFVTWFTLPHSRIEISLLFAQKFYVLFFSIQKCVCNISRRAFYQFTSDNSTYRHIYINTSTTLHRHTNHFTSLLFHHSPRYAAKFTLRGNLSFCSFSLSLSLSFSTFYSVSHCICFFFAFSFSLSVSLSVSNIHSKNKHL